MNEIADLREQLYKVPKGHYRIAQNSMLENDYPTANELKRAFSGMAESISKRSGPHDRVIEVQTLVGHGQVVLAVTLVGDKRGWLR